MKYAKKSLVFLVYLSFCTMILNVLPAPAYLALAADGETEEAAENLDAAIPNLDAYLATLGISALYSEEGFAALENQIAQELAHFSQENQSKKIRAFLEHAKNIIDLAGSGRLDHATSFYLAKRILYTVWSEDRSRLPAVAFELPDDSYARRGLRFLVSMANRISRGEIRDEIVEKRLRQALRLFVTPLNIRLDIPRNPSAPVGEIAAATEAHFLHGPQGVLSLAEKSELSPFELAKLEISPNHPAWYTRNDLRTIGRTAQARWEYLEKLIERKIAEDKRRDYQIARARKVLFFDSVKNSATSPKADAEDAFGVGWKIKWGDEIQPEVISNRLYVAAGAKITDLVYANGPGPETLVLIFPRPGRDSSAGNCSVDSVNALAACLLASEYNYNLAPNIFSQGTIDRAFFEQHLLPKLPLDKKKAEQWWQELEGLAFATFRESLLELLPGRKVLARAGSPAINDNLAIVDRVARGLVLFNMWIANRDAKDANNKGYLLELPQEGRFPGEATAERRIYLEGQHDMGHSLGAMFAAGEVNSFQGAEFIDQCGRYTLCFKEPLLYLPRSWQAATYSDILFMAEHILSIQRSDLEWIVAQTNWPRFLRSTMVNRLLERQQGIFDTLGLEGSGFGERPRPAHSNYVVLLDPNLQTSELRFMANEFGIAETRFADFMRSQPRARRVQLTNNGKISDCETGGLIEFLQRELYPSGITQRMSRLVDDQAEVGCAAVRGTIRHIGNL